MYKAERSLAMTVAKWSQDEDVIAKIQSVQKQSGRPIVYRL